VRVNFDSVIRLVNLVGGVEVYSDRAFTARNGDTFTQGYNYMDGARALVFARERYAFAEGDRIRGQNQERVIEALIKKMSQPSQLAHFGAVFEAMQGGFETNMPGDQIAQVVSDQLKSGADWTIDRASVDGTGLMAPTYTYGSQDLYVMVPDEATVAAAHEQIAAVLAE
ncbi:MAG: LCP family protein, partial [Propionibacteriaceae bacterium]|jgi:anionic cell wall polymer biosynthesis LytR-Cps2A-Psr (LCP) family protein|nr:LCP family protein [Propionibacteriaceae bacterium]